MATYCVVGRHRRRFGSFRHAAGADSTRGKGEEEVLASKKALTRSAAAVFDFLANTSGGLKSATHILDTFDMSVHVEGDPFGFQGLSAYADVEQTGGGGFSTRNIGDTQAVSNIDARDGITLYEAWADKSWEDQADLKIVIIDLIQNSTCKRWERSSSMAPSEWAPSFRTLAAKAHRFSRSRVSAPDFRSKSTTTCLQNWASSMLSPGNPLIRTVSASRSQLMKGPSSWPSWTRSSQRRSKANLAFGSTVCR